MNDNDIYHNFKMNKELRRLNKAGGLLYILATTATDHCSLYSDKLNLTRRSLAHGVINDNYNLTEDDLVKYRETEFDNYIYQYKGQFTTMNRKALNLSLSGKALQKEWG